MKTTIAATAIVFSLASSAAFAQSNWYGAEPIGALPAYHVTAVVRAAGLRPVSRPIQRGDRYVIHAVDSNGDLKRVVVDAEFGDIRRITSLSAAAAPGAGYRWGPPRRWWGDEEDVVMRPPAPVRRWRDPDAPRLQARTPIEPDADAVLLPPKPPKPGVTPKPMHEAPRTAAVEPTQRVRPPVPRSRPSVAVEPKPVPATPQPAEAKATPDQSPQPKPSVAAKPSVPAATSAKPHAAPPQRTAAPRVVLPGGPQPQAERAAETSTRSPDEPSATGTVKREPSASPPLPPVQPLN